MDDLLVVALLIATPLAVAWMVIRLHDNWTRKKIAESGASPELVESLYRREESPSRFAALKWGIVVVALGLGVSMEAVLPYDFEDPIAYGVIFVLGGLALILYYLYVEKWLGARPPAGRDGPPGSDTTDLRSPGSPGR